ncbi:MAG: GTPase/DUF3482 domain-containing protein [Desulfosalsimonas sp.]|uniref:GTPase/DUF3482 domain-containing protein n=1 Tax=Desulfosalsimonas sp. TaxID=3073848 RepID=UPI0039704849
MTKRSDIPVFAVLGHPNEGKSSVVATLAENDAVPVSPTPGETRECRDYPVFIDDTEVIRFVDTPGFQNPRAAHKWITQNADPEKAWIDEFIRAHEKNTEFAHECRLLTPLAAGAGVIFVVDGTRPVRTADRLEMDILRLTGAPRMAVINTKDREHGDYIEDWKTAARMHFNVIRIFDAQRASFAERMDLLKSLKAIDPDWDEALQRVIDAFETDWHVRLEQTAAIITDLLASVLQYRAKKTIHDASGTEAVEKQLAAQYRQQVANMEKKAHHQIKKRFKHNIFSYDLPDHSLAGQDLFSEKTIKALGLTRSQMAWAGAGIGAGIGAKADLALAGLGFGVFTALGGALGAGSAAWGSRKISRAKIKGQALGGLRIQAGPVKNDQLLFVIIDRMLIYFWHVINWAHSRRDRPEASSDLDAGVSEFLSARWNQQQKTISRRFFKEVRQKGPAGDQQAYREFSAMIRDLLKRISRA